MTTSLASQLSRLQQRPSHDRKISHSFLFKDADAKQFSREQIYELAVNGLQSLVAIDNRLNKYVPLLFDRAHIRRERVLLTPPEQHAANAAIEAFLTILSPHMLLTAAHQAVEYLIRVWEIHTFNVASVVQCFLPFHDHAIFARALMLLDLRDTGMESLTTNQLNGAVLLGSKLRELCGESRKVLRTVCDAMTATVRYQVVNHGMFALFAGVCSFLARHPDGEAIFRVMVPVLSNLVTSGVGTQADDDTDKAAEVYQPDGAASVNSAAVSTVRRETISSALVVWCAWAQETQFGLRVLASFMKPFIRLLLRSDFPISISDGIGVLALMFRTQTVISAISDDNISFAPVFQQLMALPWRDWAGIMPAGSGPMISTLVEYVCVRHLQPAGSLDGLTTESLSFLETATRHLSLRAADVRRIVEAVAHNAELHSAFVLESPQLASADGSSGKRAHAVSVLHNLQRRYAVVVDSTVVAFLKVVNDGPRQDATRRGVADVLGKFVELYFSASPSSWGADDGAPGGDDANHYLSQLLSNSVVQQHGAQGGSGAGAKQRLPLTLSLIHYLAEVRALGLSELKKRGATVAGIFASEQRHLRQTSVMSAPLFDVFLHAMASEGDASVAKASVEVAACWLSSLLSSNLLDAPTPAQSVFLSHLLGTMYDLVCRFDAHPLVAVSVLEVFKTLTQSLAKEHPLASLAVYFAALAGQVALSRRGVDAPLHRAALELVLGALSSNPKAPASPTAITDLITSSVEFHRLVSRHVIDRSNKALHRALSASATPGKALNSDVNDIELSVAAVNAFVVGEPQLIQKLVSFFDATVPHSYAARLLAVEKDAHAKRLERGGHASGRGAKTETLPSADAFVPSDTCATTVANAIESAAVSILRSEAGRRNAYDLLVLLKRLGKPMPSASAAPEAFSHGVLQVFEKHAGNSQWVAAATLALLSPETVSNSLSPSEATHVVALAIVIPILFDASGIGASVSSQAPGERKTAFLQQLQSAIEAAVGSTSGKRKDPASSSAVTVALRSLLSAKMLSVTSASALVEVHAANVDPRAVAALTNDAAVFVANSILPLLPVGLRTSLIKVLFPSPKTTSSTSLQERRRSNLVLVMESVVTDLVATKTSSTSSVPRATVDVVEYLLEALDTVRGVDSVEYKLIAYVLSTAAVQTTSPGSDDRAAKVAPWYRAALSALSSCLAAASSAADASSSVVFVPANAKKPIKGTSGAASSSGTTAEGAGGEVADAVVPLLLSLWDRHGMDAAFFVALSSAGFERLFVPLLQGKCQPTFGAGIKSSASSAQQATLLLTFVTDVLSAKFSAPHDGAWRPASDAHGVEAAGALMAGDLTAFLKSYVLPVLAARSAGRPQVESKIAAMKVMTAIVGYTPSLQYQDDEDDEEVTSAVTSLGGLLQHILTVLPLRDMAAIYHEAAGTKHLNAMSLTILQYLSALCDSIALSASGKALRREGMRQALELITTTASVCGHDDDEALTNDDTESSVATNLPHFLSGVLRVIAPLLSGTQRSVGDADTAADAAPGGASGSLLHVAVLALLLRLTPIEGTEAIQFATAVDFCRDLIVAFDVASQMQCVAGLMCTLLHPEVPIVPAHASLLRVAGEQAAPDAVSADVDATDVDAETLALVQRVVKPNKVRNQQDSILRLVVSVLKHDQFLGPFIAQQQRGGGNQRRKAAAAAVAEKMRQDVDDADANAAAPTTADASEGNSDCMRLLVSALALFANYHSLNDTTADDDAQMTSLADGTAITVKGYTTLLELFSGNALACILAGINEPTFVMCQERLLNSTDVALQQKGLETLLDRLHQSLPTTENVLSDDEAASRRKDLRDPKKKLTAYDLVLLKARPLTTKRSMALFSLLSSICSASFRFVVKPTTPSHTAASKKQMAELGQLAVTAAEELLRIVGGGGSLIAEATLAQSGRLFTISESQVNKLLGSKTRTHEAHQWVTMLLKYAVLLAGSGSTAAATHDTVLLQTSVVTAIATATQTLGAAFVAEHALDIVMKLSEVAQFSVSKISGELARETSGALLRRAVLNALVRTFSSTWLMCAPYLPTLLAVSSHRWIVDDADAAPLAEELLQTATALLEPRVILEAACTAIGAGGPLLDSSKEQVVVRCSTHSIEVLYRCINGLVARLSKEDISAMQVLVAATTNTEENFWLASLHCLASSTSELPSADHLNAVFDTYLTFFVKFKAARCETFFSTLVSWAFEESSTNVLLKKDLRAKRVLHRITVFLALYNRMLSKLQSLVDFTFPLSTSSLVSLLVAFGGSSTAKAAGVAGDDTDVGSARKSAMDPLVTSMLDNAFEVLRRMGDAQVPVPEEDGSYPVAPPPAYFGEPAVFNALMPALVQYIACVSVLSDDRMTYDQRVRQVLIPSIRSFFKAIRSSKLWSKTQAEMLKHLRHTNHRVRRAVLSAFRGIYADGGDEMAAMLMSEMLPAVVEATEDTHDDVVEESRLLCNELSNITGRDVLHVMSS